MNGIESTLTWFRSNLKASEAAFYLDTFDTFNPRIYRIINKIKKELDIIEDKYSDVIDKEYLL